MQPEWMMASCWAFINITTIPPPTGDLLQAMRNSTAIPPSQKGAKDSAGTGRQRTARVRAYGSYADWYMESVRPSVSELQYLAALVYRVFNIPKPSVVYSLGGLDNGVGLGGPGWVADEHGHPLEIYGSAKCVWFTGGL